jgi:SNF2 family DNA or RNA helicase
VAQEGFKSFGELRRLAQVASSEVEAGIILKEYLLRGMAERMLVLTPATLVGQWREEMAAKFEIEFATSYDSPLRNDPKISGRLRATSLPSLRRAAPNIRKFWPHRIMTS